MVRCKPLFGGAGRLWKRPLPDLLASDDREATLQFDRSMVQKALQNGGRLLRSDRNETEKHDPARRGLPFPVDQLSEVAIESDEQPTFRASLLKNRPVRRTWVRHRNDIEARALEVFDRGSRNVLIREDADHAAPRSTE